ncbi:MAG: hypothetical protein IPQ13_10665 [Holophagaceae bacterium]|nr:hypothetical protein [Holophagaceae bacterium]
MQRDRVANLIRFALASARREDHGFGDLGIIHLLKLMYLADLGYAATHDGQTFTEVPWIFFHFGPWDRAVWAETEAQVIDPEIEERSFGSRKTFRIEFEMAADALHDELSSSLPVEVTREIGRAVHEFGTDTNRLLKYVYKTEPMLRALPNEQLRFSGLSSSQLPSLAIVSALVEQSKSQQRKAEEARAHLREAIVSTAAHRRGRYLPWPSLNEREKEMLSELTQLLEDDEDHAPVGIHGDVHFSDELWSSDFRLEHGLS